MQNPTIPGSIPIFAPDDFVDSRARLDEAEKLLRHTGFLLALTADAVQSPSLPDLDTLRNKCCSDILAFLEK
jgi:hypothetical protein